MNKIVAIQGDITKIEVDAIVNAANTRMIPGGGVDGAINAAAGPELAREMRKTGGCKTGDIFVTPAFRLPAKWVIHAVGPVYDASTRQALRYSETRLASCYTKALAAADRMKLQSISFPLISTGVYGYPMEDAIEVAVGIVADADTSMTVNFVAFDKTAFRLLKNRVEKDFFQ